MVLPHRVFSSSYEDTGRCHSENLQWISCSSSKDRLDLPAVTGSIGFRSILHQKSQRCVVSLTIFHRRGYLSASRPPSITRLVLDEPHCWRTLEARFTACFVGRARKRQDTLNISHEHLEACQQLVRWGNLLRETVVLEMMPYPFRTGVSVEFR
jgi:hypothetical protein